MYRGNALTGALIAALGWALPLAAQPPEPAKIIPPLRNVGVKNWKEMGSCGAIFYYGVVEKVEGRVVTLTCHHINDEKPKSLTFEAINVLAHGGLVTNASGGEAYLWSDMQKGDTVRLEVARDTEEDKQYVTRILIEGRLGGRVPASQRPKGDESRVAQCNILNDINNGLDVDDLEIAKWFPTRHIPYAKGERPPPPIPGGLNAEYQKKLDVIRAKKKEQELKATPPKKDDKK